MTDISNWDELVHVAKIRATSHRGVFIEPPCFSEYVVVPLNAYQLGNLLGMLLRARVDGDWHGELCDIIACAMEKAGITDVRNNRGDHFTQIQVFRRLAENIAERTTPDDD